MLTVNEIPQWLWTARGDAVKVDYIKKIFVEVKGFGDSRKFFVNAVVDGGAKADDWVIVDVFSDLQEAKNCIKQCLCSE